MNKEPAVSKRIQKINPSPIRKLVPLADAAKERGVKVYHMNIGQPDIETPPAFYEGIEKRKTKTVAYAPSQGLFEYQDALIKYYSWYKMDFSRKNILVTTGGSEAIVFTMVTTMAEGDEIIIPEPYYANYNGFALMSGINIVPIRTYLEDGFRLPSEEEFEAKITPKTKAILVCTPHNPTGVVYRNEDLEKIIRLAIKHNLYIVADEVYREFNYIEGVRSLYSYPEIHDRLIIVDSISKRYSACGARIGCMVTKREDIIAEAMKLAQARLSPPTLGEWGATEMISMGPEYFKNIIETYRERIDVVCDKLAQMEGVKFHKPEGAFYLIVSLDGIEAEDFCSYLLRDHYSTNPETGEKETMMVSPATGFYSKPEYGKHELRIACMLQNKDSARALDIFYEALKAYRKQK